MPVTSPNAINLKPLERVLDTNEDFIGPKVWDQLVDAYTGLDTAVAELEKNYEELEERLSELNTKISVLEADNETLAVELQEARGIILSNS
jgi:chaperonin cofactor prefoldin